MAIPENERVGKPSLTQLKRLRKDCVPAPNFGHTALQRGDIFEIDATGF
jgi:hypothetical protein